MSLKNDQLENAEKVIQIDQRIKTKSNAHLQTMVNTLVLSQNDKCKTVGGLMNNRYMLSEGVEPLYHTTYILEF